MIWVRFSRKLADLVIMNENPLDDIHNINMIYWVMKQPPM